MNEKLELEVEKILEIGIEYLKKVGVPSQSAFVISPKGRFVFDPFDFSDKPKAKKILKKIAKKHKATMAIAITNALIVKLKGSRIDPSYLSKEVIWSYGETKNNSFGICQEFERDKNGQIVLGNRIDFPVGTGSMTGFMCRKNSCAPSNRQDEMVNRILNKGQR